MEIVTRRRRPRGARTICRNILAGYAGLVEFARPSKSEIPNGVYACEVSSAGRALPKFFYACSKGTEMYGPAFTPNNRTLCVAVQSPGEVADSTVDQPSTRKPDFSPKMPPRPAVVAITREDGGVIGI